MAAILYPGQIILAHVSGASHNPRPVVVIKPPATGAPDELLFVTGISGDVAKNPPPEHVLLPWARPKHRRTGLKKRCAAKCEWSFWIRQRDIGSTTSGLLSPDEMKRIMEQLARLGALP